MLFLRTGSASVKPSDKLPVGFGVSVQSGTGWIPQAAVKQRNVAADAAASEAGGRQSVVAAKFVADTLYKGLDTASANVGAQAISKMLFEGEDGKVNIHLLGGVSAAAAAVVRATSSIRQLV